MAGSHKCQKQLARCHNQIGVGPRTLPLNAQRFFKEIEILSLASAYDVVASDWIVPTTPIITGSLTREPVSLLSEQKGHQGLKGPEKSRFR